jgi:4-hydroxybenzoate polyprenyltransferase
MNSNSMPQWLDSPAQWTDTFTVLAYLMAIACVYHAIRVGARQGVNGVLRGLCMFAFFIFAFWFVESLAHHRTPYYAYSTLFGDLVPFISFGDHASLAWIPSGFDANTCTRLVGHELHAMIPLCVLLVEASLAYAAMRTAASLSGSLIVQPILAGFALLLVDALADPLLTRSHLGCARELPGDAPGQLVGTGLGLWHWFLPQPSDLGLGERHVLGAWFSVPIFNFAAWLVAPVVVVALANLFFYGRRWALPAAFARAHASYPAARLTRFYDRKPKAAWRGRRFGAALLALVGGGALLFAVAPNQDPSPTTQYLLVLGAVGASAWVVLRQAPEFKAVARVDHSVTVPVLLSLAVSVAGGVALAQFLEQPWLMTVVAVVLPASLWLFWLPYRSSIRRFIDRVENFDRFVRAHYFGFTAIASLGGAAMANGRLSSLQLAGLLVITACFHVYSYVLNDVIDLPLDRTQPRRHKDPLVRGTITKQSGLAVALATVPLSLLVTAHMVHFEPLSNPWAFVTLLAAFGLMAVYNYYGKKLRHPWMTDIAQGVAWGALAPFGALVADPEPHPELTVALGRSAFFFAYCGLFIFLINGIHGGLRDLATDARGGKRTLAIALGAQAGDRGVKSSVGVVVFAHAVHGAMFVSAFLFLWFERGHVTYARQLGVAMFALFVLNVVVLHRVVRANEERRGWWVSAHVFTVLLPPVLAFVGSDQPSEMLKVTMLCSFFVPLPLQEGIFRSLVELPYRRRKTYSAEAKAQPEVIPT